MPFAYQNEISLVKRRKRDVYGNWTWEDDEETDRPTAAVEHTQEVGLDWRDYIALAIASLETVLLPMVVLILILAVLSVVLTVFR